MRMRCVNSKGAYKKLIQGAVYDVSYSKNKFRMIINDPDYLHYQYYPWRFMSMSISHNIKIL